MRHTTVEESVVSGDAQGLDVRSTFVDGLADMAKRFAIIAFILAATAAVYIPSIDGEFVFDDEHLVSNRLVTEPFARPADWVTAVRPVTTFTFALNHLAVGFDTRGWHLTNVAIHLATVVLAWALARLSLARARFSKPEGAALAAASLFALHPVQTEAVAYLSQRSESLASGFYLAALLLLLVRDEAPAATRRALLFLTAAALHVLGLGAKPIAVTLPMVWLLHAAMLPAPCEGSSSAWQRVRRRLPAAMILVALSAASGIATLTGVTGSSHAGFGLAGLSPANYAATELRVIPTYLRLLVWPAGQCADWFFRISKSFWEPAVLSCAALLAALVTGAILVAVRVRDAAGDEAGAARAASFGSLFFLIMLLPTSTVVPLRDPLAEHRVYLAALGVFVAAGAWAAVAVRRLAGSRAPLVGSAVALAVLAALGVASVRRSAVWSSSLALWSDAAQKSPEKARVHLYFGNELLIANRPEEALAEFNRARELARDHTISGTVLLEKIVRTLLITGRREQARADVGRVLARLPRYPAALALLAMVEFDSDRDLESERAALSALATDPRNTTALFYLGKVRRRGGDLAGARKALELAAATSGDDSTVFLELGEVDEHSGALAAACAAYARAAQSRDDAWSSAQARASRARLRCP